MGFQPGSEERGGSIFQEDESQGWVRRMREEMQETLAGMEGGCGVGEDSEIDEELYLSCCRSR